MSTDQGAGLGANNVHRPGGGAGGERCPQRRGPGVGCALGVKVVPPCSFIQSEWILDSCLFIHSFMCVCVCMFLCVQGGLEGVPSTD